MAPSVCYHCGAHDSSVQSEGYVTCSVCGVVDAARTSVINTKDTYDGYDVADGFQAYGHSGTVAERERARREEKFKDEMKGKAIDWLFNQPNILGMTSLNNPLGERDASHPFIKSVMIIYQQIRYKETLEDRGNGKRQQYRETVNSGGRRVQYHLAVAIRFAAMQNNLLLVYSALGKEGDETFPKVYKGERAVVGKVLPVPFLKDMIPSNPEAENPIGEYRYLYRTQKLYLRLLKRPSDPLYTMISNTYLVLQRLRALVNAPDKETLTPMLRYDEKSNSVWRDWDPEDFDYFRESIADKDGWDKVLRVAYNLYRAQQTVMLWSSSTSYIYAVPLALTAAFGVIGTIPYYSIALMAELCAQYGAKHGTAKTANNSLRRMIIAWTSSFRVAGIPIPHLNLPTKGLVGEGTTGWNGDARRAVPEAEIWAVGIEPVANNWRRIMQSRLKTRTAAVPYTEDLLVSRTMFAQITRDCRVKPRAKHGFSARARLLTQMAEEQWEDRPTPASEPETPEGGWEEIDGDNEAWDNDGLVLQTEPPHPGWIPSVLPNNGEPSARPMPADIEERYRALENRAPLEEIETALEKHDTSDEEDGYSSDDEARPTRGLGLKGVGIRKSDFAGPGAFTVGADGSYFREKVDVAREEELWNTRYSPEYSPFSNRSDFDSASGSERRRQSSSIPPTHLGVPRSDRQASPAISVSTLHSLASAPRGPGSTAMSRSSSIGTMDEYDPPIPKVLSAMRSFIPKPSRQGAETDPSKTHIACLIRERDEYTAYRSNRERVTGRLVSKAIETYINEWLGKLRAKGAMPRKISPAYLASIGLAGKNPMYDDLSTWILTQEWRWSPLECVLRAGIQPRQLPVQMVPHSKIGVIRMLEHHATLRSFQAVPELPPIPDRFKADPQRYRREIKELTDAWEEDVSDGFPVFFPHHEKLFISHEDDVLFELGEWAMHIASAEEVAEKKKDTQYMRSLDGEDDTDLKMKKRKRQQGEADKDKISAEFAGYAAALDNPEHWVQAGLEAEMSGERGDEDADEEDNIWGYEDDEEPVAPIQVVEEEYVAEVPKGKRKARESSEVRKKRKATASPVPPVSRALSATPAPIPPPALTQSSIRLASPVIQPPPAIPPYAMLNPPIMPPNATLHGMMQSSVRSATPTTPRLPVGMQGLLNPIDPVLLALDRPTPSPTPSAASSSKRARPAESPSLPPPAKRVKGARPTAKSKNKPQTPNGTNGTKNVERVAELEVRKALTNRREVCKVQFAHLEQQMKQILIKAGATPAMADAAAAGLGGLGVKVDPEGVRKLAQMKAEKDKLNAEIEASRKETMGMPANKPAVKEMVRLWAAEKQIPLRLLGWGKKGTVLE